MADLDPHLYSYSALGMPALMDCNWKLTLFPDRMDVKVSWRGEGVVENRKACGL